VFRRRAELNGKRLQIKELWYFLLCWLSPDSAPICPLLREFLREFFLSVQKFLGVIFTPKVQSILADFFIVSNTVSRTFFSGIIRFR
jgi:hypothetical protein